MRGDANCYQRSTPCTARPSSRVNRAEMAILLQRAYALSSIGRAPIFPDNDRSQWYFHAIQTAADHCILQGDGNTGRVRPADSMSRAEMIVMVDRAEHNAQYGVDCGVRETVILNAVAVDATHVRVGFSAPVEHSRALETSRYLVERVSGGSVGISDVRIISDDTVELTLNSRLRGSTTYRLTVQNLRTTDGEFFTDTDTFTTGSTVVSAEINDVVATSATRIRVSFTDDVAASSANDEGVYMLERVSNNSRIGIDRATIVNNRTVDLDLSSALTSQATYRLSVDTMRLTSGETFSDSQTFAWVQNVSPELVSVSASSSTRLRLTFNVPLNEARAEQSVRYRVTTGGSTVALDRALLINSNTVELTLNDTLETQREYTVEVFDMLDSAGVMFSDTGAFLYTAADLQFTASLSGIREVPPVVTSATGTGTFTLRADGLHYDITVRGLSGSLITGAHFHHGDIGEEGDILETITFTGTRAVGTWTAMTANERDDLLNGDVYVNVHTAAHPDGEIRGQVTE